MLSTSKNSFLVSAIVSSIVQITVGGPLDCISGPCVTVEGVGKLKLGTSFYPILIPSQSKAIPFKYNPNVISMQCQESFKEVGKTPSGPIAGSTSLWGFLLERPLLVNTGDDQNISEGLYLSDQIAKNAGTN